jgi:hypothetical protein
LRINNSGKALLGPCESGKHDYSLQVENLPKVPPLKGQMDLITIDGNGLEEKDDKISSRAVQGAHD